MNRPRSQRNLSSFALLRLSCKEHPVALCVYNSTQSHFVMVTESCREIFGIDPLQLIGESLEDALQSDFDRTELGQMKLRRSTAHSCLIKTRCGAFVWAEKIDAVPNQLLFKCLQRVNNAVHTRLYCESLDPGAQLIDIALDKTPSSSSGKSHIRNESEHMVSSESLDSLLWRDPNKRRANEPTSANASMENASAEYSFEDVFEEDYTSSESSPATDVYPRKLTPQQMEQRATEAAATKPTSLAMYLSGDRNATIVRNDSSDWGWFFDMSSPL